MSSLGKESTCRRGPLRGHSGHWHDDSQRRRNAISGTFPADFALCGLMVGQYGAKAALSRAVDTKDDLKLDNRHDLGDFLLV